MDAAAWCVDACTVWYSVARRFLLAVVCCRCSIVFMLSARLIALPYLPTWKRPVTWGGELLTWMRSVIRGRELSTTMTTAMMSLKTVQHTEPTPVRTFFIRQHKVLTPVVPGDCKCYPSMGYLTSLKEFLIWTPSVRSCWPKASISNRCLPSDLTMVQVWRWLVDKGWQPHRSLFQVLTCMLALRSINMTLRSLNMTLRSINMALRSINMTLRSINMTLRSINMALRSINMALRSINMALRSINMALRSINMALRSINMTLRSINMALRSINVTLRSINMALRSVNMTLRRPTALTVLCDHGSTGTCSHGDASRCSYGDTGTCWILWCWRMLTTGHAGRRHIIIWCMANQQSLLCQRESEYFRRETWASISGDKSQFMLCDFAEFSPPEFFVVFRRWCFMILSDFAMPKSLDNRRIIR